MVNGPYFSESTNCTITKDLWMGHKKALLVFPFYSLCSGSPVKIVRPVSALALPGPECCMVGTVSVSCTFLCARTWMGLRVQSEAVGCTELEHSLL